MFNPNRQLHKGAGLTLTNFWIKRGSAGSSIRALAKKKRCGRDALKARAHAQTDDAPPLCQLASITQTPAYTDEGGSRFIPLLGPSQGCPFAASLEIIAGGQQHARGENRLHHPHSQAHSILELVYVLSGSGHLVAACSESPQDVPSTWPLSAGSSVLSWAHTTCIVASQPPPDSAAVSDELTQGPPHTPDATRQQQVEEDQLAVLKFHLPVAFLSPLSLSYGDTESAFAVLEGAMSQLWHNQGTKSASMLDSDEASQVLSNAHKRARKAFNTYNSTEQQQQQQQQQQREQQQHDASTSNTASSANSGSSSCSSSSFPTTTTTTITAAPTNKADGSAVLPLLSATSCPLSLPLITSSSPSPGPSLNSGSSSSLPIIPSKGTTTTLSVSCNGEDPIAVPLLPQRTYDGREDSHDGSGSSSNSDSSSRNSDSSSSFRSSSSSSSSSSSGRSSGSMQQAANQNILSHASDNDRKISSSASDSTPSSSSSSPDLGSRPPPLWDVSASVAGRPANESVLIQRAMEEFHAFQFPNQRNQLALAFDPSILGLSLSFGVEVFTPGHVTPLHIHNVGHELFFVLSGKGDGWCDGHHIPVKAGDCIVFPPGSRHGLDNPSKHDKMYTLQMMVPDDAFLAFVQSGQSLGSMDDEDICMLTANRCS